MKKSPTPERLASAERVRSLRASLGLTFEALARAAGVSVAAVHAWEYGQRIPSAPMLAKLLAVKRPKTGARA